jgi:hypothetical protein
MRRQLPLIFTLFAWLLASGGQWDLLQTFAWGRMFASYSQSMSFEAAVNKTFSVEGRCEICAVVSTAKQQQDAAGAKAPGNKAPTKIFLASAPAPLVFASPAPSCVGLTAAVPALTSADRPPPSLPPPRAQA